MTDVALIGDIGGQMLQFQNALDKLGVDDDFRIPEGLTIIQVGDLVRLRGVFARDNLACVETAETLMDVNPGRYTQLLGNHESPVLSDGYPKHWKIDEWLGPAEGRLQKLWKQRRIQVAVAVKPRRGVPKLVTHAGLSRLYWGQRLKSNRSAVEVAARLNEVAWRRYKDFEVLGRLTHPDRTPNPAADCVQATAASEVYDAWVEEGDMPFPQIHGHSSPYDWEGSRWWPDVTVQLEHATVLDKDQRRTVTDTNTYPFTSIDWMLGDTADRMEESIDPLILHGATVAL